MTRKFAKGLMIANKLRLLIIICVALAAAGGFVPITYLATPTWTVLVVDEQGRPLEGMTVRLTNQNYSAEPEGHRRDLITDSRGSVEFSSQIASSCIVRYVWYTLLAARAGIHASFGRHASVFVFGQGREGSAIENDAFTDWTGSPDRMESRIVAERGAMVQ